jgi:hypothetical protein
MPMEAQRPNPPGDMDAEKQQFIRTLEANGQLVDVGESEDTSKLPGKITHVRYPDGRIHRIRFTSSGI